MNNYNILIIEDDSSVRESICIFLELNGFQYSAAPDGITALNLLSANTFDLIVCDINLPDIIGYEILAKVRDMTRYKNVPFIFLSAYADKLDIKMGLSLGADEYITKPFLNKTLIDKINFLLNRKQDNS